MVSGVGKSEKRHTIGMKGSNVLGNEFVANKLQHKTQGFL